MNKIIQTTLLALTVSGCSMLPGAQIGATLRGQCVNLTTQTLNVCPDGLPHGAEIWASGKLEF
jgi:hypothetical protein